MLTVTALLAEWSRLNRIAAAAWCALKASPCEETAIAWSAARSAANEARSASWRAA